jgi:hypothetical protein
MTPAPEQFVGELMTCSICDLEEHHTPGSGWIGGVIGLEGKPRHAYYMCPGCIKHLVAHPHPEDPSKMIAGLDPTKGIEHKANRDYAMAFLGAYAMKTEIEMAKVGVQ